MLCGTNINLDLKIIYNSPVIPIKFNNKHKTSVDTMLNLQFLKLLK